MQREIQYYNYQSILNALFCQIKCIVLPHKIFKQEKICKTNAAQN